MTPRPRSEPEKVPRRGSEWDGKVHLWALRAALQEERRWSLLMIRDLVKSVHKFEKKGKKECT